MIDASPSANSDTFLIRQFFGVLYAEQQPLMTSGSMRDLPYAEWGTVNWRPETGTTAVYREGDLAESLFAYTGPALTLPSETYTYTASKQPVDPMMSRLEAAAQAGDERAFVAAQKQVDWQRRSAKDFIRGVQLALAAGAYLVARNLAVLGASRFPNHAELQKYARVLAPPKASRSKRSSGSDWKASRNWLIHHSESYRGQWVALRDGELVGSANTLKALSAQLHSTTGLLITKVY